MTFDPIAFFAETAAAFLAAGPHEDPRAAASAVFNRAYSYGMPMEEYALKTLRQARQARGPEREEKLGALARYEIVDRVLSCEIGDASASERKVLERARRLHRAKGPARPRPEDRRPAEGSVVVARRDRKPFTISNVRWATNFVEQRWMHEDSLSALIRRLADDPPEEHVIIAVAGKPTFSPSRLAFSGRRRLAVCYPDRTDYVDTARFRRLRQCFDNVRPARRGILQFRGLCRDRALTVETPPIDRKLVRMADQWQRDVNELHALFLPATDVEIRALTDRCEA